MRNLNCRFTSFDLEVMLLLANQRAAWAFTFIHFDSLKYYKSTEVLQLLQYCNYYSYCCCSSSAMNQLMLLCISNQVFKCVWCFLCLQFLTFVMSHVINMTSLTRYRVFAYFTDVKVSLKQHENTCVIVLTALRLCFLIFPFLFCVSFWILPFLPLWSRSSI